jgi:hypothetical protein
MIKYTSKDIVNRAEQLADLQNSDFISDSEKSALLNEAWNTLYQKIINSNDRSFIRTLEAYDGLVLPSDFYQLSSLYVEKDRQQIDKVNPSQRSGYTITNDTLHLSADFDDVNVILEYFPTPKTIFYSSGRKDKRDFPSTPSVVIDEDLYLSASRELYSYSTGATGISVTVDGLRLKNGTLKSDKYGNVFTTYTGNVTRKSTPFVIKGNAVTYDEVKSSDDLSAYLAMILDETEQIVYFLGADMKLYTRDFEEVMDLSSAALIYCRGDGLYISEGGELKRVLGKVVESFPLGLYSFEAFVDETYCILRFNGLHYKASYGFSTLFDYPNNIYYTILAYSLAISFKMKQQGDTAGLTAKYDEALNQFYDSISRDANQNYIIKDVYKNGRGRIWS